MKLLVLLCCVLGTSLAVPVRRSLASKERLPILVSQGTPPLNGLPGFVQIPQFQGVSPFTQVAMPPVAAQYAPWNGFPDPYNYYGFPVGGMPPRVGGMPPPVGGMPPPVGGMPPLVGGFPPPVGGRPPAVGGMPPSLGK